MLAFRQIIPVCMFHMWKTKTRIFFELDEYLYETIKNTYMETTKNWKTNSIVFSSKSYFNFIWSEEKLFFSWIIFLKMNYQGIVYADSLESVII